MPVVELREWERIGAHSHIRGLGLDDRGKARHVGDGMVGQEEAREAAGVVVDMIKEGRFAGQAILIAGPPGSGKSALAIAIARELGEDVPVVMLTGSEIYSAEVSKTEFLTQALRKAIGVRIREMRRVYEGKVTEVKIEYTTHPLNPYMRVPSEAKLTLETRDERKSLKADQEYAIQLVQLGVEEGDVIQIDTDSGRIVKLGRAKGEGASFDLEARGREVDVPSGPVAKEKEFVYTLTLHELDVMRARAGVDLASIIFGLQERREISPEIRARVDREVRELIKQGKAEFVPGVMFIDEASMLDIETFAFLNRAIEQELSPIIIFATNRGITRVRGTDMRTPHGMPLDLLDRLLVILTRKYNAEEIRKILEIRAEKEDIDLKDEALDALVDAGVQYSLRYAAQLLIPSWILARKRGSSIVEKEDVEKAKKLFANVKRSAEYLESMKGEMIAE